MSRARKAKARHERRTRLRTFVSRRPHGCSLRKNVPSTNHKRKNDLNSLGLRVGRMELLTSMSLVGTLISSGRSSVWRRLCAASVSLPHRASRAFGLCRTGMVRSCRALSTSARQPAAGCSFRLFVALALWVMDMKFHACMQSARRRSACPRSEGLPWCFTRSGLLSHLAFLLLRAARLARVQKPRSEQPGAPALRSVASAKRRPTQTAVITDRPDAPAILRPWTRVCSRSHPALQCVRACAHQWCDCWPTTNCRTRRARAALGAACLWPALASRVFF